MRRKARAPVGLEHVVLQHEVLGVRPVVRDLACVVIAHDVRVAEKESNERFSSMTTITCLILWMPCRALGAAARRDTEPQPTAAPTASTTAAELSALAERRVEWEDDWGTGPLIEVEVGFEVAE